MHRSLALASSAVFLAACGGSSGGTDDSALVQEAQALRQEMLAAGMEPVSDPPPVSDELFRLGQALFFDKLLSGSEDVSCATCHLPQFGTGDGRTLSDGVRGHGLGPDRIGGVMIPRNSPPLFALHERDSFFWDGRMRRVGGLLLLPDAVFLPPDHRSPFSPGLEAMAAQAMLPPVSREEMRGQAGDNDLGDLPDGYNSSGGSPEGTIDVWVTLADRLLSLPVYQQMFLEAYPGTLLTDFHFGHVGNALAAFEARAFARTDSPFDRFLRGDDRALSADELRGGREFLAAGCAECHHGPLLSDGQFHNTGLPQLGPGTSLSGFPNPFADLIVFGGGPDHGREDATGRLEDRFRFRTASLLNVELTGPWGHAGQFERLRDFVAHYEDPAASNLGYDVGSNVTDPRLVHMVVENSAEVLSTLHPSLQGTRDIDLTAVVDFLKALTADDAGDLDDVVPVAVPSGLPLF